MTLLRIEPPAPSPDSSSSEPARGSLPRAFHVKDIVHRLGVDTHRVIAWIRSGKLRALDVSEGTGKRARWRITPEALAQFEAEREAAASPVNRSARGQSAGTSANISDSHFHYPQELSRQVVKQRANRVASLPTVNRPLCDITPGTSGG
jgi:hypothetical protein